MNYYLLSVLNSLYIYHKEDYLCCFQLKVHVIRKTYGMYMLIREVEFIKFYFFPLGPFKLLF